MLRRRKGAAGALIGLSGFRPAVYAPTTRPRIVLWILLVFVSPSLPAGEAAIASAHPAATAAGREILEAGGNAFDAAIAVAATLAVVEPYSSGLGGGGFFLLHTAKPARDIMLDARERAPLAAHRDMYLSVDGQPIPRASVDGPLAAAIPGVPAALDELQRRYGKLPLARSLAPAIRLAAAGLRVTPRYRRMAEHRHSVLLASPEAAHTFLERGFVPDDGYLVRQPELARTLELLARHGKAGFYAGEMGARLVKGVRAAGGNWSAADLMDYRVMMRSPFEGRYRGQRVVTAALPSAGGVGVLQMLGMLEGFDLPALAPSQRVHLVIETMRRAYRDRAMHLGDPDFIDANVVERLLAPAYIGRLRASIDRTRATPSATLAQTPADEAPERRHTTHFSIIDGAGNRVGATLSINTPFGSGFVVPGTGVLLNNEMDDFVTGPGLPNAYGLIGGEANAIAPGKRPLSSMTPTFVETSDRVVVLGTPGGSRIVSMVLLATLDVIHGDGGPADWVRRARFHHQYQPDVVEYEPGAFDAETAGALQAMGHRLRAVAEGYGNMEIVALDRRSGQASAAADPRGEGSGWAGSVSLEKRSGRQRAR